MKEFLWVLGMNELVGVLFLGVIAVVFLLGGSAVDAFSVVPFMGRVQEPDISLWVVESADGEGAVGEFRAIDASPRQQAGDFRDGDAEELLMEDMVPPSLQVRDDGFQSDQESLCDFAQKDPAFAGGVQEGGVRVLEELLRKQVQHCVRHIGGRKDLVVGEVCQTGQDVRVVDEGTRR